MSISAHTLIKAIRAISEKADALKKEIESSEDPELSYLEEEWHAYLNALSELEKNYDPIQQESDNLPPYEELVFASRP